MLCDYGQATTSAPARAKCLHVENEGIVLISCLFVVGLDIKDVVAEAEEVVVYKAKRKEAQSW